MAPWLKSLMIWLFVALVFALVALGAGWNYERIIIWRYYVWWEEDRSAEMRSRLAEIKQHVAGLKEKQDMAAEVERFEAWIDLHKRRMPTDWNEISAPTMGLPGTVPASVQEQLSPTGRIDNQNHIAAVRLIVDWNGKPLDVAAWAREQGGPPDGNALADWMLKQFDNETLPVPKRLGDEEHALVRSGVGGPRLHGEVIKFQGFSSALSKGWFGFRKWAKTGLWYPAFAFFLLAVAAGVTQRPMSWRTKGQDGA